MSNSYSVAGARAHLPAILDEVEAGKEVQVTRRGRPVAVLLSAQRYDDLCNRRLSFGDAYRSFLCRIPGEDIGLPAEFFESLRARDPGRRVRL